MGTPVRMLPPFWLTERPVRRQPANAMAATDNAKTIAMALIAASLLYLPSFKGCVTGKASAAPANL